MPIMLMPEPNCGRCAELLAACLLGADETARFEAHLTDHVGAPSLYSEINEQVPKAEQRKWQTRSQALLKEQVLLFGEIPVIPAPWLQR